MKRNTNSAIRNETPRTRQLITGLELARDLTLNRTDIFPIFHGPLAAFDECVEAGNALARGPKEREARLEAVLRAARITQPDAPRPGSDADGSVYETELDWRSRAWKAIAEAANLASPLWLRDARMVDRFHLAGPKSFLQLRPPFAYAYEDEEEELQQPTFRIRIGDKRYAVTVPGNAFRTTAAFVLAADVLAATTSYVEHRDRWHGVLMSSVADVVLRRSKPRPAANALITTLAPGFKVDFSEGGVTGAVMRALDHAMNPPF